MKRLHWVFLAVLALVASLAFVQVDDTSSEVAYTLTVLHNNDGESQVVNAGSGLEDFGGVARFARLVSDLRAEAAPNDADRGVVVLSSGDNYLAGPEFNVSQGRLDAVALRAVGYDALAIGNHEFDFGPDVFADFVRGFQGTTQFVSASLRLIVTPQITADRTIIMDLTVEQNEPDFARAIGPGAVPPITTRRADTKLLVADGGTAVIGGVFKVTESKATARVPGIHKLPCQLQRLFDGFVYAFPRAGSRSGKDPCRVSGTQLQVKSAVLHQDLKESMLRGSLIQVILAAQTPAQGNGESEAHEGLPAVG